MVGGTPRRYDTENTLIYRLDQWRVVAGHTLPVPYFDGHTRFMPVVRLQQRSTGALAWFVNVHNPADTHNYGEQTGWRAQALAIEAAHVVALRGTGLPVFVTGDLNDRHDPYCTLTAGAPVMTPVSTTTNTSAGTDDLTPRGSVAEPAMTSAGGGGRPPTDDGRRGGSSCRPPAHAQIDWIFGAGATFSGYTVDHTPLRGTSDHPIVSATAHWAATPGQATEQPHQVDELGRSLPNAPDRSTDS